MSSLQKTALKNLPAMLASIRRQAAAWKAPIAGTFADGTSRGPFKVLISTILSLRTKDEVTEKASHRLFARADTPEAMLKLTAAEIEKLVYPVGFYRIKARSVLETCRMLVERFQSRVPDDIDTLLTLKGVGRKTANLVVTVGYGKPGICVDTHVHRISNIWGLVKTRTPDETEAELRRVLPKRYWTGYNDLLVSFGQNLCVPVSPHCSRCPLAKRCPRLGVKKSR